MAQAMGMAARLIVGAGAALGHRDRHAHHRLFSRRPAAGNRHGRTGKHHCRDGLPFVGDRDDAAFDTHPLSHDGPPEADIDADAYTHTVVHANANQDPGSAPHVDADPIGLTDPIGFTDAGAIGYPYVHTDTNPSQSTSSDANSRDR